MFCNKDEKHSSPHASKRLQKNVYGASVIIFEAILSFAD